MDRLQDPGNIGTMIRTAEAAGYRGIIVIKGTGDVFSPKVVRAAAGSVLRMPFMMADGPDEAAGFLKSAGKKILGTRVENARPFYDVDMSCDTALVIGNEGNGMSREFSMLADENIMIAWIS